MFFSSTSFSFFCFFCFFLFFCKLNSCFFLFIVLSFFYQGFLSIILSFFLFCFRISFSFSFSGSKFICSFLFFLLSPSFWVWKDWSNTHKMLNIILSDLSSFFLEIFYEFLKNFNKNSFNFTSQQLSLRIFVSNISKLLVILQPKLEVLIRYINIQISTKFSMFFNSLSTSRKGVFVNFIFNLFWCIN